MSEIMKVDTVQQYNDYFGVRPCTRWSALLKAVKGSLSGSGKNCITSMLFY